MRLPRTSYALSLAIACVASVAPEAGCVQVPPDGQQPVLATHVQDWRDEVIYQLIVDRFFDGDVNNDFNVEPGSLAQYQGGDWKGIEDHLDYLQALGVTTLWISPIVQNVDSDADIDAYHGYWQQDLTQVNPHFGDLASLRSMVASAHDRGMKIVLDIVCNHMGQVFFYDINRNGRPDDYVNGSGSPGDPIVQVSEYDPPWQPSGVLSYSQEGSSGRAPILFFNDPTINRLPPQPGILATAGAYHGFGHIEDFSVVAQRTLGDFTGGLKDLATELPEVRATLVDAFATWVEKVDFDGYRIDTIKHVESDFWPVFAGNTRARLAEEGKTDFLMFGEAFDGDDQLIGSYTMPGMLDSVFYFSQHFTVFSNVFENAYDPTLAQGTDQIQALWQQKTTNYGTQPQPNGIGVAPYKALVNFIDNHDVPRFLFASNGDVNALRNALTLLFTEDGIPNLYYGTEQEFSGGNDPANREVLWTSGMPTDGDTFAHIANLARLRKAYVALRRGDTKVVWSSPHVGQEDDAGIFAFERAGGDAGSGPYALVVLNTNDFKTSSTSNGTTPMQTTAPAGTTLVDVLDPAQATYSVDASGQLRANVPAQKAMILVPQSQVGQGS
ncbi:MAG TPA: alpha-amylase family glycosyl hydrolase [Polyangiaceae bacterium]